MKNIVVLTGAGISAQSGIKTFRGNDGLWENHRIEDVATYDAWQRNPDLVRNFYNERRKQLYNVEPNEAHRQLIRLEEQFNVNIVTQNVDDLHERAGSTKVLHLHGELKKVCSETDPSYVVSLEGWELTAQMKDPYGKPLRPFIVWFGEAVPMIEPAIKLCENADVMIIIGTSLNVYPAAGLLNYCSPSCKTYLIDPNSFEGISKNIVFIQEKATEGVRIVVEDLLSEETQK
jgi:NAD-dependent deacetylase